MMKSKYIIVGDDLPIVFTELITHADLAKKFQAPTTSAGFCHIENGQYVCYGESVSLRLKSKGDEDSSILNLNLGTQKELP